MVECNICGSTKSICVNDYKKVMANQAAHVHSCSGCGSLFQVIGDCKESPELTNFEKALLKAFLEANK